MPTKRRAVFLDRDGVVVEDLGLVLASADFRILPGVPVALRALHEAGFVLVVVSNQAVVARGLLSEVGVRTLQNELVALLQAEGAPTLEGFYFCPHHPAATLEAYRMNCDCRKPRPGLLLRAANDLDLDLGGSFMVGDRPTDIQAGAQAGCSTIWIHSGRHEDAPIETVEPLLNLTPSHTCASLAEAATWILAST